MDATDEEVIAAAKLAHCDEFAEKDSRVKVIHKKNGGICFSKKLLD